MSTTASQPAPSPASIQRERRPVVACQQLTKTFKDFWMRDRARAVDRLDLVINEREVFGLLGPNGSGKSTTIKLILGLLKPTSGRVMVFGKSPSDVATKSRIGYLPEESYLYPFLNARETLEYYAKLFSIDAKTRTRRIDELLDMVGLTHAQFRPVREYSKGMQRRIGIAQALINDPELLILDEPTTGLDPIGTRQVKDLILELGRRGKTVILSSHLLTDVEDVVDRMVILYGGRIRGEGSCDELLTAGDRTTIETDTLDDATIAEIDEVIRRRSNGEQSIRSVSAPRQKLEELFLGIVEQAREEQAETSGATEGGTTASFLKGEDAPVVEGAALISSLVAGEALGEPDAPAEDSRARGEAVREAEESEDLLDSLLHPQEAAPEPENIPQGRVLPKDDDVDLGVIGSLIEDEEDSDSDADPSKESGR
ncbi:MAG: ABC transporter ATP-binding protein [Phycisphaerales bacterium]|nr:ABC transporter ATP-binding protein [Phycisphaerales bacterium]